MVIAVEVLLRFVADMVEARLSARGQHCLLSRLGDLLLAWVCTGLTRHHELCIVEFASERIRYQYYPVIII